MENGSLMTFFLGFDRRSRHANFLLLNFVKTHSSLQRFEQVGLAESTFEPLLSRALDDLDIISCLRNARLSVSSGSMDDLHTGDTLADNSNARRRRSPTPDYCDDDDDVNSDRIDDDGDDDDEDYLHYSEDLT
jgi:hypothetical protein